MSATSEEPPAKQAVVPQFAPVPRAKDRHNGWKPEVQRAFIEALAETGSVRHAARRAGRAEVGATDRALHGVEVPPHSWGTRRGRLRQRDH